ncbi:MAG: flavodoxin family protein [Nitrospirae bacterium]|nr:flavodoxin family protein [Nitrospirota bacterium]
MNVIAFMGSPRKGGNTELILNEAIKAIEEEGLKVKVFDLNLMDILPCQDCGGCEETGECIIIDDMAEVSASIRTAQRIILASPVYFSGVSAQAKAMIDRCQHFWCEKYLLRKPLSQGTYGRKGLFMVVGGRKKDIGIECSEATATAFFRTISVPEHKTLGFLGIDAKGAILKHPTALKEAYSRGKWLITREVNII